MLFKVSNQTHTSKVLSSAEIGGRVFVGPQSENVYDLNPSVADLKLPGVTIEAVAQTEVEPAIVKEAPKKPVYAPLVSKPVIPPVVPKAAPPSLESTPTTPAGVRAPSSAAAPVVSEGLASWQKGLEVLK